MKRIFDILVSSFGLVLSAPILLPVMYLVYRADRHSPFYIAPRVGKGGKLFKMVKLRSMVVHADKSGVDSTSAKDPRITGVGKFIRAYKLDELPQLFNVLKGDMSLVGPRPNVKRETDLYSIEEQKMLSVRPGITDLASIVFSDENAILADSADPDLDYNQRIRPWKSRLAILYVENQSLALDVKIIINTVIAVLDRRTALARVSAILDELTSDKQLKTMAAREVPLVAFPPPGMSQIVLSRG